jgi:hypothetical protein
VPLSWDDVVWSVVLEECVGAALASHGRGHRFETCHARLYYLQVVERGKDHLGALCVVAAHLAERAWRFMDRGTPYVVCDTDGTPVTAEQAKAIIAERWTVPEEVRLRRRSRKGEGPSASPHRNVMSAQGATRRPSPSPASLGRPAPRVKPAPIRT